jgi:ABC-2 type transport system permease protein
MNPAARPPLLPSRMAAATPSQALRRLFLTLFLRGRGARGLNQNSAPKSIVQKLLLTLLIYVVFGCFSFGMVRQHIFGLAVYLHAMTFMFLGMFVASSAGEILFNKEEADILLHRPIDPRTMLWSKIRVLVDVSFWLAGAFNLGGIFAGLLCPDGSWRFPLIHIVSTALEALFCTGCIVLIYQLCLRWFGRERLEGLMTMVQVIVSVGFVLSGQILPRVVIRFGDYLTPSESSWWIGLLPPSWFAGLDDAVAGSGALLSWILGGIGVVVTGVVLRLAFGKLARDYESGLQSINETVSKPKRTRQSGRWIDWIVTVPPFRWWLREPVSRAAFVLTAAYLIRDREIKLRIYPGIAPVMMIPFIFLLQNGNGFGREFCISISGAFLGLVPLSALSMLHYSQQWQASDIFRSAPIPGPAAICHGARRAVLCFLTIPVLAAVALAIGLLHGFDSQLSLLLPGIIAMPVYAVVPGLFGGAVPLSAPGEEAKSAGRGLSYLVVMMISFALSGIAIFCRSDGWYWQFLVVEAVFATGIYAVMRHALGRIRWRSAE